MHTAVSCSTNLNWFCSKCFLNSGTWMDEDRNPCRGPYVACMSLSKSSCLGGSCFGCLRKKLGMGSTSKVRAQIISWHAVMACRLIESARPSYFWRSLHFWLTPRITTAYWCVWMYFCLSFLSSAWSFWMSLVRMRSRRLKWISQRSTLHTLIWLEL